MLVDRKLQSRMPPDKANVAALCYAYCQSTTNEVRVVACKVETQSFVKLERMDQNKGYLRATLI